MNKIIFNRHSHFFLWFPVGVYYGVIFFLSQSNPSHYVKYPFPSFDKILHIVEYSFFGLLLARAFFWEKQAHHLLRHVRLLVVFSLVVGAFLDELHQYFIPARQCDFFDLLADVIGGTSGAVIGRFYYLWRFDSGKKLSLAAREGVSVL